MAAEVYFKNDSGNTTTNLDAILTTPCSNEYCVSDSEYVDMIQDYIYPNAFEWSLITLYIVVFVAGVVGNFLVCFAVWRNYSMRTVTNYFIVNLAVADFLVCSICLPPTVLEDVTETWYIGSVMCRIVKYMQSVSVCVSVLTLASISVERWYAICRPLRFHATPKRARLTIIIIWLVSLLIVSPELVGLNTVEKYPGLTVLLTACKPTWSYMSQVAFTLFLSIAMYVIPFTFMFIAYYQIAHVLWSNNIPSESSRDQLHPKSVSAYESQLQSRRKAAKMLIAVVFMFGVCYLPVHLLNILRYVEVLDMMGEYAGYLALIAHWLCYFNSAINPIIYNFMSAKFRREYVAVCCWCSKTKKTPIVSQRNDKFPYQYRCTNRANMREPNAIAARLTII